MGTWRKRVGEVVSALFFALGGPLARRLQRAWRPRRVIAGAAWVVVLGPMGAGQPAGSPVPIGQVQGRGEVSPLAGRVVTVQGVVTGWRADRNSAGAVFHTVFIQDEGDGDPRTSDGLALFYGPRTPEVALGDELLVTGTVIEYFGLTEMSHRNLVVRRLARGRPLPLPVTVTPAAGGFWEALEGMRIGLLDVRVAGPTHHGCGFTVGRAPRVLPVLAARDEPCPALPVVKVGDGVPYLRGPLTYHFDQYTLVLEPRPAWPVVPAPLVLPAPLPPLPAGDLRIASVNMENHFDAHRDTDHPAEPLPLAEEIALRRAKFAVQIGDLLGCPTLLAVQEVEHAALLTELAAELTPVCGFTYGVVHRESVDARGIDVALLVDPRRAAVLDAHLDRACTALPTGISDPAAACAPGTEPLFSRPPLVAELALDGVPFVVIVVHFKSKLGEPAETAARRTAQAWHVRRLALEAKGTAAHVLVLGDVNDTPEAETLAPLTRGGALVDLLASLPAETSYSYIYGGIPQRIDGFFADPELAQRVSAARIVHANAPFPAPWQLLTTGAQRWLRATDHDLPVVDFARALPSAPSLTPAAAAAAATTVVAPASAPTPASVAAPASVPTPAASHPPATPTRPALPADPTEDPGAAPQPAPSRTGTVRDSLLTVLLLFTAGVWVWRRRGRRNGV